VGHSVTCNTYHTKYNKNYRTCQHISRMCPAKVVCDAESI
jgi:hypothetical protein